MSGGQSEWERAEKRGEREEEIKRRADKIRNTAPANTDYNTALLVFILIVVFHIKQLLVAHLEVACPHTRWLRCLQRDVPDLTDVRVYRQVCSLTSRCGLRARVCTLASRYQQIYGRTSAPKSPLVPFCHAGAIGVLPLRIRFTHSRHLSINVPIIRAAQWSQVSDKQQRVRPVGRNLNP